MADLLSSFLNGAFGTDGYMKDFAHASRLYRDDSLYDFAPKAGWMYYVRLGINPKISNRLNASWAERFKGTVGLLAKSADMPTFTVETEVMNQYNRKTVVQKRMDYAPITITFHDDMANATTDLWTNYYGYYSADGNYSSSATGKNSTTIAAFGDTKYKATPFAYGLNNSQDAPFFTSIEIYQLNKKKFLGVTLINPIIKEWKHGNLDQTSNKMAESRMTIAYESVIYTKGFGRKLDFRKNHYDQSPSPLAIGGGLGGVLGGATDIFGENGSLANAESPLDYLGVAVQGAALLKNASKLTAAGIQQEGYSILSGQLTAFSQAGRSYSAEGGTTFNYANQNQLNIGGLKISGNNAAVNLFTSGPNSSVKSETRATPHKPTPTKQNTGQ